MFLEAGTRISVREEILSFQKGRIERGTQGNAPGEDRNRAAQQLTSCALDTNTQDLRRSGDEWGEKEGETQAVAVAREVPQRQEGLV